MSMPEPTPRPLTTETWKGHVENVHLAARDHRRSLENAIQAAMLYAREQGRQEPVDAFLPG